jgi:hypothetical protein
MLLNDLLNGAHVIRWTKKGSDVTKEVTSGPDLRPHRAFVQVERAAEEK